MVVVGGVGTVLGPVIGTTAYLVLEQTMSGISEHWQIGFGLLLVLMAIFRRGGIAALLSGLGR
jgi:branched-chain amino acid transport system permease protein